MRLREIAHLERCTPEYTRNLGKWCESHGLFYQVESLEEVRVFVVWDDTRGAEWFANTCEYV